MTMRALAIYRSSTFSPGRHRNNDAAIMDATTELMESNGWLVERIGETDVETGAVPPADLYLNMCQGAVASQRLLSLEASGARMLNRPSAVLGCHRHRLVRTLSATDLPFPVTAIVSTTGPVTATLPDGEIWVKRGDVHAQEAADVVHTSRAALPEVLAGFHARGVEQVALQEHIAGPVIKFYGIGNGSMFHAFREDGNPVDGDTVDLRTLRSLAFRAAEAVGLRVFGGDAVVPSRMNPMLVDLNDWPSFAPVRAEAAAAISDLAEATVSVMQRSAR